MRDCTSSDRQRKKQATKKQATNIEAARETHHRVGDVNHRLLDSGGKIFSLLLRLEMCLAIIYARGRIKMEGKSMVGWVARPQGNRNIEVVSALSLGTAIDCKR